MKRNELVEPTSEQCNNNEKVFESELDIGYAIWYPQMGGYIAKAIVLLDKNWTDRGDGCRIGGCFDMFIWHDSDFPFHNDENPVEIHHCDPEQFIDFGKKVKELNDKNCNKES